MLGLTETVALELAEPGITSQPNKRFVEVDELGKLTLFLCPEAGSSTTDAWLAVDSGWTARLRGGLSRPTFHRNR